MPIPMYEGPILSKRYIGMGQYRLFPMYRQILPIINTSKIQVIIQSRCIHINFPRFYLLSLAAYSRASQLQINFPRLYLHPLTAYSRANQPHFNTPRFSCLTYGLGQFFMAFKTSSLRSRARSFIRGFAPEDESMVDIILLLIS